MLDKASGSAIMVFRRVEGFGSPRRASRLSCFCSMYF